MRAAGALEAIYSIMALRENIAPPTINLENPDDDFKELDLVPKVARDKNINIALSNSFGFGATKVALIFKAA